MIKSALQSSLTNDVKYRNMNTANVPSSEYLISTTILTQNEPSVTFDVSGLGSQFRHLKISMVARMTESVGYPLGESWMRFNGVTTNGSYAFHWLMGNGSNVSAASGWYSDRMIVSRVSSANAAANVFGAAEIDILDFASTNKNKTIRSLHGLTGGASGLGDLNAVHLSSGVLLSTNAISSITVFPNTGNFVPNSRFSIYGVTA